MTTMNQSPSLLPWSHIFSFVDGLDAARASSVAVHRPRTRKRKHTTDHNNSDNESNTWTRADIDLAMTARLKETELGRSLLHRHGDELPLSKLVFCVDHQLSPGTYLEMRDHMRQYLKELPLTADLYQPGDIAMCWARVLFVIDGVAVFERVNIHVYFSRFPVARLHLPQLLDVCGTDPFLLERIPRQDEMEFCWEQGMEEYFQVPEE